MQSIPRRSVLTLICIVTALIGSMAHEVRASAAPTTFYALGDSLTWGYGTAGGYRDPLYTRLSNANYSPQFVGKSSENATPLLTANGQQFHDGHSGWRSFEIDSNLTAGIGFLSQDESNPTRDVDFILLMIGTNDVIAGYSAATCTENTRILVDHITSLRPDANVILASVPPIGTTNVHNPADRLLQFNASLPGMVSDFQASGRHVSFVDQYVNFINPSGDTYGIGDGLHPDAAGYGRIADTWFSAIRAVPEPTSLLALAAPFYLMLARRR